MKSEEPKSESAGNNEPRLAAPPTPPSDTGGSLNGSEQVKTTKPRLADRATDPFSQERTPEQIQAAEIAFAKFVVEAMSIPEGARFYNLPEANANYRYWANQVWRADDAVALSFGKDPRQVDRRKLSNYIPIWPFARKYWDRLAQVRELYADQDWVVAAPTWFVPRADELGIDLPQELLAAVKAVKRISTPDSATTMETNALKSRVAELEAEVVELRHANDSVERELQKERVTNPKARLTYEKLVFALALKFKFTGEKRNSAATNVRNLLLIENVSLDQGIIHERLSDAWLRFKEDHQVE